MPDIPRLPAGEAAAPAAFGKDQQGHAHKQGKQQQQQHRQSQQAATGTPGGQRHARHNHHQQKKMACVPPAVGRTVDGLPKRPASAICPFYSHTGSCSYKQGCVYHHPDPEALLLPIKHAQTGQGDRDTAWCGHQLLMPGDDQGACCGVGKDICWSSTNFITVCLQCQYILNLERFMCWEC
jgi:hypothetical protein